MKTEDLFNSKNDIRLCSACYGYGLNYNYFIADHTTKKVLKTISGEKFKELMDDNVFEYVEKIENIQSWRLKSKVETYTIHSRDLYDFLKWTFVAGEHFQQDWHLNQIGELDEIKEPDFDEWFNKLEQKLEKYKV
jgi:hypothetical protein